jgi:hypothetical protein
MTDQGEQDQKQSFIASEDRPESRLNPDMPIAEMRVRDLGELVAGILTPIKHHKFELKHEPKELKYEHKHEHKYELFELKRLKIEKYEKIEKFEHKYEKWEYDEIPVDFPRLPGPEPDPRIDQLIEAVSQLREEVAALKQGGRRG